MQRNTIIFASVLAAIALFVGVISYLEPNLHDVWHFEGYWHDQSFPEFLHFMYFEMDPRVGSLISYFICGSTAIHVVWTSLIIVTFFVVAFTMTLGRWPRPRELRDSYLMVLLFGLFWIATPNPGVMMFYRIFCSFYLHALCLLMLVLLPYRFALGAAEPRREPWRTPAMFVAGLLGGFTNEHTVPTAMLAVVVALWWMRRRGTRLAPWMFAGLAGLAIGFLLLFFAPANDLRYSGLAQEAGIVERIIDRGLSGNFELLLELSSHSSWQLWLLALALVIYRLSGRGELRPEEERLRYREIAVLAVASLCVFGTMLASPLQGFRLMFAPAALLWMAGFGAFELLSRDRLVRIGLGVIAAVVIAIHVYQLVVIHATSHREFKKRVAIFEATPKASIPRIPAYTHLELTHWFYGDDLRIKSRRTSLNRKHWQFPAIEIYVRGEEPAKKRKRKKKREATVIE